MSSGRVLFFDFDGTLIDSMPQHAVIFGGLLNDAYGIDAAAAGRSYLALAGAPLEGQFAAGLALGGRTPDAASVAALIDEFWARYGSLTPVLFPDVADVLARLAGERYRLVITTQGRQKMVEHKLELLGLREIFDLVLGVDPDHPEWGKGPAHFGIASRHFGLSDADLRAAVLTGDGAFDMQVARTAGMTAVGRLTGENGDVLRAAGADHLIRDLTELQAITKALREPD